ncbi:YolD-like family protein [Shouchella tritolerans]|uniref:YolD-like family protein n=1 Tax=Shouchella tritolerans TaxID=2979466 RepID=UPI0021E8B051|nr:YolD-like family protein [Shouchella tritolerans]
MASLTTTSGVRLARLSWTLLVVRLTYWQDGYYVEKDCHIYKVDELNKRIRIEYGPSDDSIREWIDMRVIYDVQRI